MLRRSAWGLALLSVACGGGEDGAVVPSGPTFHEDVEPVVQQRCQTCHHDGGIAPFSLVSYDDARLFAPVLAEVTAARTMPPWGAFDTADCTHPHGFVDDLRLTDAEIALFAAWAAAGAPEGDPAAAPPPFVPPNGLPDKSLSVAPSVPYVTTGDVDEFPCIVVDPGLTDDVFLDGWHFVPGYSAVVHHILLYASGAAVEAPDHSCTGLLGDAKFIGGWAPGMAPTVLPAGVAVPIASGSKLVMQMHYHPGGTSASDATAVELRFATALPTYVMRLDLFGNMSGPSDTVPGDGLLPGPNDPDGVPVFLVPGGVAGHTEEMVGTVPAGAPTQHILGALAHMHWLGTDMRVGIERPGGEECLLATPAYDFAWQRMYTYDVALDELPTYGPGDKLRLRCTYNNTLENPYVAALVSSLGLAGAADATLGENTYDEMCITALPLLTTPVSTFPICLDACDRLDACDLAGACASLAIDCPTTTAYTSCQYQCVLDASCADLQAFFANQPSPFGDCFAACG